MQRFDDDESKYCKAYIQYQCGLVSFFDTPRFVCTEILGNIWRHCIADGYKDQGKNIFYPHRRRISRKCLCAKRIYNCLYDHHTDRHGRLLENRWNAARGSQIGGMGYYNVASERRRSKTTIRRKCLGRSRLQVPHRTRQDQDRLPSKDP